MTSRFTLTRHPAEMKVSHISSVLFLCLCSLVFGGCAIKPAHQVSVNEVMILPKEPENAQFMGVISVQLTDFEGPDLEKARGKLIKKAAAKGGNVIVITGDPNAGFEYQFANISADLRAKVYYRPSDK